MHANTEMTQMLELSDMNFKGIKMLQQAVTFSKQMKT